MKTFNARVAKRLAISLIGLGALGGCAVVPYNAGYYDQGYAQPVYAAPAPVYVAPAVNFGFGYSRGYYGRGYGGGYHGGYRGGRW